MCLCVCVYDVHDETSPVQPASCLFISLLFAETSLVCVCVYKSHVIRLCACMNGCGPGGHCGTPQTNDSAGPAEALSHVDGAWEGVSLSPALGSTVSASGAGWPGASAYSALIKAGMEGTCEACLAVHIPLPPLGHFTRAIAGFIYELSETMSGIKHLPQHSHSSTL